MREVGQQKMEKKGAADEDGWCGVMHRGECVSSRVVRWEANSSPGSIMKEGLSEEHPWKIQPLTNDTENIYTHSPLKK